MPYNAYTKMSREDVLAIRAYLNTVTPVRNPVVANTLPFPFNIRDVDAGVGRALLQGGRIQARSAASRRNGIAARSWSTARRIAAPVTRRRRSSAATRRRNICRARYAAGMVRAGHHDDTRRGLGGMVGR